MISCSKKVWAATCAEKALSLATGQRRFYLIEEAIAKEIAKQQYAFTK
jgi:hypothetical protein